MHELEQSLRKGGIENAIEGTSLRVSYAMSGTDIAYGVLYQY